MGDSILSSARAVLRGIEGDSKAQGKRKEKTDEELICEGIGDILTTIIQSDDKIEYGEAYLEDKKGIKWEIKVRWNGDRKHYLKLKPIHKSSAEKFRAAVGKKYFEKPWKYKELATEEWRLLALYVKGEEELSNLPLGSEVKAICTEILNDLVYVRKLTPKE